MLAQQIRWSVALPIHTDDEDMPILTVHYSFVVPFDEGDRLHRLMKEALEHVTYKTKIKAKWNGNLTKAQLYAGRAIDRDWYLDRLSVVTKPEMAKGYQVRMQRHTQSYVKGLEVKIK